MNSEFAKVYKGLQTTLPPKEASNEIQVRKGQKDELLIAK